MNLLPVAEAQSRLMALTASLPTEQLAIPACAGRWLTEDVAALRDQPWADLSAMDGYAIRAGEWPGPWNVTAESAAGGPLPRPSPPAKPAAFSPARPCRKERTAF